ncbi:hypothetical protein TNCV_3886921 [Trichonephila clavipes]|nr:hypothetical protein TNCV_3886921 [Trichonephila clavipes]
MNPDSVSVLMTTAHVSGGAPASGPGSGIYCRAAYSNFTRCDSVGVISWDKRSSLVVLQSTLTARRYVDDILTPIVLPMLSSRPVPFINRIMPIHILRDSPNNVFKDMTSYHGLPGHQIFRQ